MGRKMIEQAVRKASTLIEALPYIRNFKNKIIVIKLGGSSQEDDEILRKIFIDIDFMVAAGMRPVVVHGGGKNITKAMKNSGIEARFVQGQRVTCQKTIDIVARVLADEVNGHLIDLMTEIGGKAEALNGRDHFFLKALKKSLPEHPEEDLGFVGEPVAIDASLVYAIFERGAVPFIAPVAHGLGNDRDTLYNINGDTASALIARELHADKLVFFMDTVGICTDKNDPTTLISHANGEMIRRLTAQGVIAEGMIPKTEAALFALEGGVNKTHIVSGHQPHALLLEIFTNQGVGTEIIL